MSQRREGNVWLRPGLVERGLAKPPPRRQIGPRFWADDWARPPLTTDSKGPPTHTAPWTTEHWLTSHRESLLMRAGFRGEGEPPLRTRCCVRCVCDMVVDCGAQPFISTRPTGQRWGRPVGVTPCLRAHTRSLILSRRAQVGTHPCPLFCLHWMA